MYDDIVEISGIEVIGVSVETSNQIEATEDSRIVGLYEQFISEEISEKIQAKVDDRIVALYTNYEDGESGYYTYAIGHQVQDPEDMPIDCEIFDIPPGKYLHFPTERGPVNLVLARAWQEIWRRTQAGTLGAERAYTTDFEFHSYDRSDEDVQVDIYISIL